jgi:hypothetical protein
MGLLLVEPGSAGDGKDMSCADRWLIGPGRAIPSIRVS